MAFTVAALTFTTREKDYGGIHVGVSAADIDPLRALLESIAAAPPGRGRQLLVGGDVGALAGDIYPRGRFVALTSLRLKPSDRVSISVTDGAGVVELTATAARAAIDRVATAHATGGDACIVGDSAAWSDRLWFWPR